MGRVTSRQRTLRRYAAFASAQSLVVVVAVVTDNDAVAIAALVTALPFLFAIGQYQAEATLNPVLTEPQRARWRIALFTVPWSLALYWWRYLRD